MYICNKNYGFLESRLHPQAKWFDSFFFLFILLFVFTVEDPVVSSVGRAGFQFYVILSSQFFTSKL